MDYGTVKLNFKKAAMIKEMGVKMDFKEAVMIKEMGDIIFVITEFKERLQRGMSADVRRELDWLIRDFNRMEDGIWNEIHGIVKEAASRQ